MRADAAALKEAVFAGGCFWCMEPPFEKLDGVAEVISGYTGGQKANPTYEEVSAGGTGHAEAVLVRYDPAKVSYADLLQVFWRQIDPTDGGGSFVDRGTQYRSAIFYATDEERVLAEQSRDALAASGMFKSPIKTEITRAGAFYPAEDYHQDYYTRNPIRYKYYRFGSGRDQYIERTWGADRSYIPHGASAYTRPPAAEIRTRLTPLQYRVTQEEGTEPAYQNEYWDNKRAGIYVDIVSGEPLFSSLDKYDSGTGWPSFSRPLEPGNIVEREDRSFFSVRTEVRSRYADSHLGHVFTDGPAPTGLRYCMNSAALRFVPKEALKSEGYEAYIPLFE